MKFKTTQKEIRANFNKIICVPYCGLQTLLSYESPVAYAGGNKYVVNCPCIHVSGSIAGMRRNFWGYKCDVVRVGQWIYKAN